MDKESNKVQRIRSRGIYLFPNLLTTAALFAGFFAIVAAIDGNYQKSTIAIFVAMVMDGLDGRVARLTSTESDFGKEYDSLSDMVAFGLAPAIVMYQWGVERLSEYGWIWGKLGWLAAFLYAVAAAMRLARFNSMPESTDKRYFEGLPSPSAAAVVAGTVWLGAVYDWSGGFALASAFFITGIAAGLMVSHVPYYSFKELSGSGKISFTYAIVIPLTFVLIALDPPVMLFLLFSGYAISGPITSVWKFNGNQLPTDSTEDDADSDEQTGTGWK
ncbi:MAG: CDP-diacylglycerol--serine O-phosphatidyltransferase [Gammaproteobacteria bacterium]